MMRTLIASGIFCWDGEERRSQRYGSFSVSDSDFNNTIRVQKEIKHNELFRFLEKRVRITCVVRESRPSGHLGDLFLKLHPTQPEVGEEVDLGVGEFDKQILSYLGSIFLLKPGDERQRLWIDPRKFYRLHDQTVDIYIEETNDDFTPMADLKSEEPGAISTGDGCFQTYGVNREKIRIVPKIKKVGDGLFLIGNDSPKPLGERINIVEDKDKD